MKFAPPRPRILVRIVFAPLANVRKKATEDGAMDGVVAVAAFPGFSSPAVGLHDQSFKCGDGAAANEQ